MSPRIAPERLGAEDAMELGGLLGFLGDWLDGGCSDVFTDALMRFCGEGYSLEELRADIARFAWLLGADEQLVGDDR